MWLSYSTFSSVACNQILLVKIHIKCMCVTLLWIQHFLRSMQSSFALLLYNALSITINSQFENHNNFPILSSYIICLKHKNRLFNHWDFPFSQHDTWNTKYFLHFITMQCDNYYYYHARQFHEVSFLVTTSIIKPLPP